MSNSLSSQRREHERRIKEKRREEAPGEAPSRHRAGTHPTLPGTRGEMKENEQEKLNKYAGISYEGSIFTKNDPLSIILWHLAPYQATLDLASELGEPLLPAPSVTSGAAQNFKTFCSSSHGHSQRLRSFPTANHPGRTVIPGLLIPSNQSTALSLSPIPPISL